MKTTSLSQEEEQRRGRTVSVADRLAHYEAMLQRSRSLLIEAAEGSLMASILQASDTLLNLAKPIPLFKSQFDSEWAPLGERPGSDSVYSDDEVVAAAAAAYQRRTGREPPDFSQPRVAPRIVDGVTLNEKDLLGRSPQPQ